MTRHSNPPSQKRCVVEQVKRYLTTVLDRDLTEGMLHEKIRLLLLWNFASGSARAVPTLLDWFRWRPRTKGLNSNCEGAATTDSGRWRKRKGRQLLPSDDPWMSDDGNEQTQEWQMQIIYGSGMLGVSKEA